MTIGIAIRDTGPATVRASRIHLQSFDGLSLPSYYPAHHGPGAVYDARLSSSPVGVHPAVSEKLSKSGASAVQQLFDPFYKPNAEVQCKRSEVAEC